MNRALKCFFALALMTSAIVYSNNNCNSCYDCNNCCYDCDKCCLGQCDGYPFFSIRSQGRDSARELVGWQQFINKYDMDERYGAFSVALEYTRSFREERIAHHLFGNDLINCCKLLVQGCNPCGTDPATEKHARAWYAPYFGLPEEYSSEVTFCPQIQNVVIDLDFYWGLDTCREGLYMRINAPIVRTKWELCMNERILCPGDDTVTFPAGYMHEEEVTRAQMARSFQQYMAGGVKFGDLKDPMRYGLINNCACTETKLGEIDFTFGWNFHLEEDRHLGLFLYLGAPAGTRPCARYLFEPIVGNGKHWELGAGLSGSWIFKRDDECDERYMGIWLEATIAHLFKTCQCRSFDFCGKPNSRYMLLAEMGTNDDEIGTEDTDPRTVAEYQYKKNLIPAINWSTFNVDVKIPVMADIAVKLGWVRDNWTFDLGYNLWARSGEKFCENCPCPTNKKYAIKGDAYVYGYDISDVTTIYPISATQSLANIYGGKNCPEEDPSLNPAIDNLTNASVPGPIGLADAVNNGPVNTSIQPVLVDRCMLNLGQAPSAITHKLFMHIGYAWKDRECDDWTPFFGIGGKVEFAQDNWKDCCCCDSNCCDDCCCTNCGCDPCCCGYRTKNGCCCNSCGCDPCCCGYDNCCYDDCCDCSRRGGLSQWGIWFKGGVAFD